MKDFKFHVSGLKRRGKAQLFRADPQHLHVHAMRNSRDIRRGLARLSELYASFRAYFQNCSCVKREEKRTGTSFKFFYAARSSRAGFSLIETLVAITILLIAILAPMRLSSQSIKTAEFAREQLTAVFLAQEGIESVIHLRDADALDGDGDTWDWFDDLDGEGCTDDGCSYDPVADDFVSCSSIENCLLYFDDNASDGVYYTHTAGSLPASRFTRVVTITEAQTGEAHVVSTVSWYSELVKDTVRITERTRILDQYEQE